MALAAQVIHKAMPADPEKELGQGEPFLEPVHRLQGAGEGLLDQVLRGAFIPPRQVVTEVTEQLGGEFPDHLLPGRLLAGLEPFDPPWVHLHQLTSLVAPTGESGRKGSRRSPGTRGRG